MQFVLYDEFVIKFFMFFVTVISINVIVKILPQLQIQTIKPKLPPFYEKKTTSKKSIHNR